MTLIEAVKQLITGRRIEQSVPSLVAQTIAAQVAAPHQYHPLTWVAEQYFIRTASDIAYHVDGDYDALPARVTADAIETIARAYITTGGVLLYLVDDQLRIYDWSRVSVMATPAGVTVAVDGSVVADYVAVTYGGQPLSDVVSPRKIVATELALDASVKQLALQLVQHDPSYASYLSPRNERLSDVAVLQLRESLNAGGRAARGSMAVLPIPMDLLRGDPAISALQLDQITTIAEATISAVYGIPIQLLGLSSSSKHQTYANREQASRDYTERVLVPFWRRVGSAIGALYGVELTPDLDSVAALRSDYSEYALKLYDAGNGIITLEEARALLGYETTPQEQQQSASAWYEQTQSYYSLVDRAIAESLRKAYGTIADKLRSMPTKRDRLIYLYSSDFERDLHNAIASAVDTHLPAVVDSAQRAAHRRGVDYETDPRQVAKQQLSTIAREEIRARLAHTLDTLRRELDEQIEAEVDIELSASHAALVARTMATGLVARVQVETWRTMERVARKRIRIDKMWLTQRDGEVRDTHAEADGQKVRSNEDFRLRSPAGGIEYASHPGDVRLSVANVVNCRCVVVPRTVIVK